MRIRPANIYVPLNRIAGGDKIINIKRDQRKINGTGISETYDFVINALKFFSKGGARKM